MAAGRSEVALREFEQVRERIALRVEVRSIVRAALAVLALIVAAFTAGYLLGRQAVPPAAPMPAPAVAAAPAAPIEQAPVSTPESAPILPKALPDRPAPADQVNAALARDVVAPAADAEPAKASEASVVVPVRLAAAAFAPPPLPIRAQLNPPELDRQAWVQAADLVTAARDAPATWSLSPVQVKRLEALIDSAKGFVVAAAKPAPAPAPVAAVTAAAAAIVAAKPKPAAAVAPTARPAAPSQPATPDPDGRPQQAQVKPAALPLVKPVPKQEPAGRYVIQVKAFRGEADAEAFASDLRAHGHKAAVSSTAVPDKGTFFRVRLGPFASLEAARSAQRDLESHERHDSIVVLVP